MVANRILQAEGTDLAHSVSHLFWGAGSEKKEKKYFKKQCMMGKSSLLLPGKRDVPQGGICALAKAAE